MIKKFKQFINKIKEKNLKYWRDMDVDRELKIEKIKNSRSKRNLIDYIGIGLVIIWFFIVIPLGTFIMSKIDYEAVHRQANAEEINIVNTSYQDILDDSNALVNFNQLVNMSASSSTEVVNSYSIKVLSVNTGNLTDYNLNISIIAGHKYYVKTSTNSIRFIYTNGNGSSFYGNNVVVAAETGILMYINYNPVYGSISVGEIISCNIIDLTQMFGDNVPTLEQCQQLFVADYYNYNAGSPISLNGLDAYSQGYNDATKSSVIITNSINPATQLFASNTSYWVPQNNNGAVNYTGRAGIYLGYTAQAGNVMTISYTGWIHNNSYLQILYESNGQYIPLVQDLKQYDVGDYSIYNIFETSFTLPVATQYLYFNTNDPQDDGRWGSTLVQLSITTTAYDFQTAIADARKYGYTQAENIYKGQLQQYTDPTGTGYTAIYQQGYTAGMNSTSEEFALQYYTFPQFIGALFDVPVRVLNSLLDFDVLGYNMKNLIFSILTISIILSIVRFILQKQGGE